MGRGRAKAKQTKVARELKYRSVDTDLASLQRELGSNHLDDDVYEVLTEAVQGNNPSRRRSLLERDT